MIAKIRLVTVSIGVLLSLFGISARASDAVVKTQIGTVSFTVAELAVGTPLSNAVRMIAVGMKRGCTEARAPGIRASIRPLAIVWKLRSEGPRPVMHVSAELFSGGRSVASTFSRTISIHAAPNIVFESTVAQITCALFRKAGYVTFSVPRLSEVQKKNQGLASS